MNKFHHKFLFFIKNEEKKLQMYWKNLEHDEQEENDKSAENYKGLDANCKIIVILIITRSSSNKKEKQIP